MDVFRERRVLRERRPHVRGRAPLRLLVVGALLVAGLLPSLSAYAIGPWLSFLSRRASRGAAFSGVRNGQQIERELVFKALRCKAEVRALSAGGPIAQPSFFAPIAANVTLRRQLIRQLGKEFVEDQSASTVLLGNEGQLTIADLATGFKSGKIPSSLVYKPNSGAQGRGIVFLEHDGAGDLTMTMAYIPADRLWSTKQTHQVIDAMRSLDVHGIDVSKETATARIHVDAAAGVPLERLLQTVHDTVSINNIGDKFACFDAGMVESTVPIFRYKGGAFETRHKFEGTFAQGITKFVRVAEDHSNGYTNLETPGSFARLGASSYFSNQTGRFYKELPYASMYDPLHESFGIASGRHAEFAELVDEAVIAQVNHMLGRLRGSGVHLSEELDGQLDLGWLPAGEGQFPTPVLIEAHLGYATLPAKGPVIIRLPE